MNEREKYERMWSFVEYRRNSPGERHLGKFLKWLPARATVIDFGCGTGRAALALAERGHTVFGVDIAGNALDPGVAEHLWFLQHDLAEPMDLRADYGYCTDVMEHIPPELVDRVLGTIFDSAVHVFFSIATRKDGFGRLIGEPLHLTVERAHWWRERIEVHAEILWSDYSTGECIFYTRSNHVNAVESSSSATQGRGQGHSAHQA